MKVAIASTIMIGTQLCPRLGVTPDSRRLLILTNLADLNVIPHSNSVPVHLILCAAR